MNFRRVKLARLMSSIRMFPIFVVFQLLGSSWASTTRPSSTEASPLGVSQAEASPARMPYEGAKPLRGALDVESSHAGASPLQGTSLLFTSLVKQMKRPCKRYDGDGCSIPFGLPFFYKTQFTLSCDRHDICYHCGVAYNIPRPRCDFAFRNNTKATCTSNYLSTPVNPARLSEARKHRQGVLQAVTSLGSVKLQPELFTSSHDKAGASKIEKFKAWISERELQVKLLARRIAAVAERMQVQGSPKQMKHSKHKAKSSHDGWCEEITEYVSSKRLADSLQDLDCIDIKYITCDFFSEVYFLAVRTFAESSYHKQPEFYCHQSFVPKCLPPF